MMGGAIASSAAAGLAGLRSAARAGDLADELALQEARVDADALDGSRALRGGAGLALAGRERPAAVGGRRAHAVPGGLVVFTPRTVRVAPDGLLARRNYVQGRRIGPRRGCYPRGPLECLSLVIFTDRGLALAGPRSL